MFCASPADCPHGFLTSGKLPAGKCYECPQMGADPGGQRAWQLERSSGSASCPVCIFIRLRMPWTLELPQKFTTCNMKKTVLIDGFQSGVANVAAQAVCSHQGETSRQRAEQGPASSYDIFLSHRGPESKTTFVGYLHNAFQQIGLCPFLDGEDLQEGKYAWECIEYAINNAPVCMVIFTRDYAGSSWCLKELHAMLETPDTVVLPIFLNVKPSDVRFPNKGLLRQGFEKMRSREDDVLVKQWEADLEKVSKIIGWEYTDGEKRLQVELVNEVVAKVSDIVNMKLNLHVAEYPIGLEGKTRRVLKLLRSDDIPDISIIKMLGIWGMGGIGKTTLAKDVYNQSRHGFIKACYVGNIREKAYSLVDLQSRLLKELCGMKDVVIDDVAHGTVILRQRLGKMRVLVVLDDVHNSDWLQNTVSKEMLGGGSRVVVTSRDIRVFKEAGFDIIYEMEVLSQEDAEELFKSHAFAGENVRAGVERLVQDITKSCGGLPLMLKVCGAHLRKETSIEFWKEVLRRLENGRLMGEKRIFECLRLSYDALEWEHQQMFLDIACGLIGTTVEKAKRVWEAQGWSVLNGLRNLRGKSLIKVDEKNCFHMHSLLRDMGREIVQSESKSLGERSRLWMPDSLTALENRMAMGSVQAMMLLENGTNVGVGLDLSSMKNLRILVQGEFVQIKALPANLKMLKCLGTESADYQDKVKTFNSKHITDALPAVNKLEVLDMQQTHIKSFPSRNSQNKLASLKELDLSNASVEHLSDSISRLKQLNVLIISNCPVRSLPRSLGKLQQLSKLIMDNTLLQNIPGCIGRLKKLRLLDMSRCILLESATESSFGDLKELTEVRIWGCGKLKILWKSFGQLVKLQDLNLSGCDSLESVPECIGGLQELSSLSFSHCSTLTKLPNSLGRLIKLKKMYLIDCIALQTLPDSLGQLSALSKLILSNCSKLQALPATVGGLKRLRDLDLSDCLALEYLPESLAELASLCTLNIRNCVNLKELPDHLGQLTKLQELDVSLCSNLDALPESLGELHSLEKIGLMKCGKLSKLPHSFGQLEMLKDLDLSHCSAIATLPSSLKALENLSTLKLVNNAALTSLPETIGHLPNLLHFDLINCRNLRSLPDSLGSSKCLQELDIQDCSSLEMLPEFSENSNALRKLHLGWCFELSKLPDSLGNLQSLQNLCIEYCPACRTLPNSLGHMVGLQVLQLTCENVTTLPNSLGDLKSLRILSLSNCSSVQDLTEGLGELGSLLELYLDSCPRIRTLPRSIGLLVKLQKLELSKCFSLQTLPNALGEMGELKELRLAACINLNRLPDSLGELKKLQELDLLHCLSLRMLPESMKDLTGLSRLRICGCLQPPFSLASFDNLTSAVTVDLDLWANPYCQAYQNGIALDTDANPSSRASKIEDRKTIGINIDDSLDCWTDFRCGSNSSSSEEGD